MDCERTAPNTSNGIPDENRHRQDQADRMVTIIYKPGLLSLGLIPWYGGGGIGEQAVAQRNGTRVPTSEAWGAVAGTSGTLSASTHAAKLSAVNVDSDQLS